MLKQLLDISKLVNSVDRTINAIDRTITLGIRVYDRVEKYKKTKGANQNDQKQQSPPAGGNS